MKLGSKVLIGGDIPGIIHSIIYSCNMEKPVYEVYYWRDGRQESDRFLEEEIKLNE